MCSPEEVALLDRLSGILGPCNLKLGIVLASLSPFVLYAAGRRFGSVGWIVAAALVGIVVLLGGARASWVTYALVLVFSGWRLLGWKRSEEHTSELQSLMRISYAVFCLKKKKT